MLQQMVVSISWGPEFKPGNTVILAMGIPLEETSDVGKALTPIYRYVIPVSI